MTKKYKVPCSWQMYGEMEVEAADLEEAVDIANSDERCLPEGSYVDGSFEIDHDVLEIINE